MSTISIFSNFIISQLITLRRKLELRITQIVNKLCVFNLNNRVSLLHPSTRKEKMKQKNISNQSSNLLKEDFPCQLLKH